MALVVYDRVQEITSTTGTGSITLGGAVAGYQSFAVVGNGNTTFYCIINGTQWEVGLGTYSSTGPTLDRTTIYSNSNGNTSPITLSGSSFVFVTYPSEKSINYDADGVAVIGTPINYSDTGLVATFASTVAGYNQVVIQNQSAATDASANLNVSNNTSTDTSGFAELGINSSTFVGTNSFEIAGGAYLASAGTDLAIGTYGAYNIHFVTDSNDTDAMTIYNDGGISLGELSNPGIGNIACNNINLRFQQIATTGGTTYLTNASPYYTQFTGTSTEILQLPDATTCLVGTTFIFDNDSTQNVTIKDGAGTTFELLVPGGFHNFVLEANGTVAGTWLRYSSVPSEVEWGTYSLQLGSTVITGGTWEGGTIQSGYGGTGLTTFTAANYALYSTSASTLTAGTLPVPAGGTGQVSFASGYIPYGNTTAALQSSNKLQFNGSYLVVGGTTPITGAVNPIAAFTGSDNNYIQTYTYNANAGISASADFVAYADNSTDAHGWADMGFSSSVYAESAYTVTGPNEAYLFGSAPTGAGATGNLVYATDSTGSANAHQWYVGGFNQAKSAWKMQLNSTALSLAGNLTFTGTGQRITGDFTNATVANRVAFQTSTTNSATNVLILPNGTSTTSAINIANNSDPTNAASLTLSSLSTDVRINSGYFGAGTYLPLTMYTGGSERLRIDTSGNVGIGTASPQLKLTVKTATNQNFNVGGNSLLSDGIRITSTNDAGTANAGMEFGGSVFAWTQTGTELMRIDSSGNVGIGTDSPNYKLDVLTSGIAGVASGFKVAASGNGGSGRGTAITIGASGSANSVDVAQIVGYQETAAATANNASLAFNVANTSGTLTERVRIDFGGNMIMATGAGYFGLGNSQNNFPAVTYPVIYGTATGGTGIFAEAGHLVLQPRSSGALRNIVFATGNPAVERMRIDSAGNVGIGDTSPGVALDVAGTIRSASATTASAATITPTAGTTNQYTVTALAAAATIAIPSGTPQDGQKLIIRIKDNGTARALTWTTSAGGYRVIGVTLPSTTVISKVLYVGCIYNSQDSFWDVVSVAQQV